MTIYLVQHGEALPEAVDPKKGLSPAGIRYLQALAGACAGFGVTAKEILHSGRERAAQSAAILQETLRTPSHAWAGLDPLDPVMPVAVQCDQWEESRIIIGHMPFLGRLATFLLAGREDPPAIAFQRGGMICLEKRGPGEWCLLWTFFPHQPK